MIERMIENVIADVINFWFEENGAEQWYAKNDAFDRLIRERFGELHRRAAQGELFEWRNSPEGRLAEIILLDQFSRNLSRDTPRAFASDGMALILAQETVSAGDDFKLAAQQRAFVYMPYMHSESRFIHEVALKIYRDFGDDNLLDYELRHKRIIDRFGRYPHRNALLGRQSTPEELAFLQEPNSSF